MMNGELKTLKNQNVIKQTLLPPLTTPPHTHTHTHTHRVYAIELKSNKKVATPYFYINPLFLPTFLVPPR